MQQQLNYKPYQDELEEELTIDIKKIIFALWSRKKLIVGIFSIVLIFFILMTFILPKKYTVDTDLYINKSNNSNMAEFNPYVISELGAGGGMAALMNGGAGAMANDIELMQSALVIDKVIRDNDLRFKKLFGIIPTKKTGKYLTAEKFLKKGISFENKKGTNVVTITYKNKDRELAYNVVNSIIVHYIELNKEINAEKSKSDKRIIEEEYNKAKDALNKKMKTVSGLPDTAMSGSGNFAGEKSKIAVTEDVSKVAALSSKLEWAKLVEEMSDSSKVIVLKEPRLLQEYEQTSPKLFTNILLGIVFGVIASLIAVIYAENTNKRLTYSMLGDKIIYNMEKDFSDLKLTLLSNQEKSISLILLEQVPSQNLEKLCEFKNLNIVKGDISTDFIKEISNANAVILFERINATNSKLYKQIKQILADKNKTILEEVLV